VIAVDAGRNLAVLVEAAVRNTILQLRGIDTYREFIERHQRPWESRSSAPLLRLAVRAVLFRARCVERQRMLLQLEAACLRDRLLPLLDLGVEEILDPPQSMQTRWSWCLPSLSSNTDLPVSKWLRDRCPACSNCISTR
jgi:hypothetical protein